MGAEAFVPPEHKKRIENRAVYDEEEAVWVLEEPKVNLAGLTKRPVSAFGKNKRPQSAYTKMAAQVNGNPRYRTDNILQVELDLPSRTTTDFSPGGSGISAPNLELGGGRLGHKSNDLEQFHPEDVIEIEATPDVFSRSRTKVGIKSNFTNTDSSSKLNSSSKSVLRGGESSSTSSFPQSRGKIK